jgi:hypothetical protein
MTEKMRIVVYDNNTTKVWLDGKELSGIKYVQYEHEVMEVPELNITFLPTHAKIKGVMDNKEMLAIVKDFNRQLEMNGYNA